MKLLILCMITLLNTAYADVISDDLKILKEKLGVEINHPKANFACTGDFKLDKDYSSIPKYKHLKCSGKGFPYLRVLTDPIDLVAVIAFHKPIQEKCSATNMEKYLGTQFEIDPGTTSDDQVIIFRSKLSQLTFGNIFCDSDAKSMTVTLEYPLHNRALGYDTGNGTSCDIFNCLPAEIQRVASIMKAAVENGVTKPLSSEEHRKLIVKAVNDEIKKTSSPINPQLLKKQSVQDQQNFAKLVNVLSEPEFWYSWYNTHYGKVILK